MSADSQITDITVYAPRVAAPASASASAAARAAPAHHGLSFHAILSALNPLQFIPVVGSIYRAVTGDEGEPTVRFFGSIAVSALTGGPIGVGINLLEKITGIDPEAIAFRLLGIHTHHAETASSPSANATPAAGPAAASASTPAAQPAAATGWTAAQLQAYGIHTLADGTLVQGSSSGADVLNGLELGRLARVA